MVRKGVRTRLYRRSDRKFAQLLENCPRFCRACRPTPRRHLPISSMASWRPLAPSFFGLCRSGWRHGVGRLRRADARPPGFPRRSIEHASNSPHRLRAIEHASRYPPSARVSDKSGGKSERPGRFANGRTKARAGPREPCAGRSGPENTSPPLWMRKHKWTRSHAANHPHPARRRPLEALPHEAAA